MNWKHQYSQICSLLVMDIQMETIFSESWNGELVTEQHTQTGPNPRGAEYGGAWEAFGVQVIFSSTFTQWWLGHY